MRGLQAAARSVNKTLTIDPELLNPDPMPSRLVTVGIIVSWLAAVGWLGYREWWRDPGQPPLLDRTDEVGQQTARWRLHLDGEDVGPVDLRIQRDPTDRLFKLEAGYGAKAQLRFAGLAPVTRMKAVYRSTPRGELRELRFAIVFETQGTMRLSGRLSGSHFTGTLHRAGTAGGETLEANAPGGLVNLLQPLHRMPGLHDGRRWRAAVFNPLTLARGPQARGWPPRPVEGLAVPDELTHHEQTVPCWRVEYRDGNAVLGRLWVRIEDAHVLRQEVEAGGTRIALEREPLRGLPTRTFPGLGRGLR